MSVSTQEKTYTLITGASMGLGKALAGECAARGRNLILVALPNEGLEGSAHALMQELESAADQREDYWKNRVQPFWQYIWPKSLDLATPEIAESLARLVIAARGEFPAALDAIRGWLKPIEHPDHVVQLLHEAGLCRRFPTKALSLLSAVIENQLWAPSELGQCLDEIVQVAPELAQDPQFRRLREYLRGHGG